MLVFALFALVSSGIDRILGITHSNLNDNTLISEYHICHIFGKPGSQADHAGPHAPQEQCWKENKKGKKKKKKEKKRGKIVSVLLLTEDEQKSKN